MMKLAAHTNSGDSLKKSKRVYLTDLEIHTVCPECKETIIHDTSLPFLNNYDDGSSFIPYLYCDCCDYESEEPMYKLISINEDSLEVEFNKTFNISVYKLVLQKNKIEDI